MTMRTSYQQLGKRRGRHFASSSCRWFTLLVFLRALLVVLLPAHPGDATSVPNEHDATNEEDNHVSVPEHVMMNELPNQMISGTCMTSEPQPDCGLHTWTSLTCTQLLSYYEWDPNSTCCSFSDRINDGGGCTLTVGGAGNVCTWRERGTTTTPQRYFTVLILDESESVCPDSTTYKIPRHSPSAPSPQPTGTSQPQPIQNEDFIPLVPIPANPDSAESPSPTTTTEYFPEDMQSETGKSGACWATEPTTKCGIVKLPTTSCTNVLQAYDWSGSCCSFADTDTGGCIVTVGGPGSFCTWKHDNGEEYTMYMAETSASTCPPTKYSVPRGSSTAGWDGPTPEPRRSTGSCWTTSPNDECGIYTWSDPCEKVVAAYSWEGSCCSLNDTDSGGCQLIVDGPGSECSFLDKSSEYTIFVSEAADGTCPESTYQLSMGETDNTFDSPTPEPVKSGFCATLYPNDSCGIHIWNESCSILISQYEWTGTCCSLATLESGGCQLTVDGPGSTCTWKELGKESYFNVIIDEENDHVCPESTISVLPDGPNRSSPFTDCVAKAFGSCLTSCESYSTFRQSFQTCSSEDLTQAMQCAAGAVSVCLDVKGKAPKFLCERLGDMYSAKALLVDDCLALQEKCSAHGVTRATCS